MINSILDKWEKILRSQIGYREGPKDNETKFGAWFGMNYVAWCAIFQSWCSFESGTTYFGKPWRFASTISARDHAKKNGRWTSNPVVGSIAMMAHTKTTGHVGGVIYLLRRNGRLIVGTIEGNTNDQGAREGNGVWLRERDVSSWDGYILLDQTNQVEEQKPQPVPEEDEDDMKFPLIYRVMGDDTGDAKDLDGAIFISGDAVTTHLMSYPMFVHHANLKLIASDKDVPGWMVAEHWAPSAGGVAVAIAHVPLADHTAMAANTAVYSPPQDSDQFAIKIAEGVVAHLEFESTSTTQTKTTTKKK